MDKLKFVAWVDTTKKLFNEVNETPFTNPELQAIYKQVMSDTSVQDEWEDRLKGAIEVVSTNYLAYFTERNSTGKLTLNVSKRQKEALAQELHVLRAKIITLSLLEDVMVTLERQGHPIPPELRASMSLIAVGAMFEANANLRENTDEKPDTIH